MSNQLGQIKHVVQLILENRSFDQLLGFLYPKSAGFEGLSGSETNPDGGGRNVPISKIKSADTNAYFRPGADPGEGFYNTNLQLFGMEHPRAQQKPTNDGFVINFATAIASDQARGFKDTIPGTTAADIMSMYDTTQALPVMSALAKGYAVCDHWFASVPTQTIPNRAFAGAATSQGRLDNKVKVFTCDSVYGRLTAKGLDWAIYGYDSAPLSRTDFPDTLNAPAKNFGHFKDFAARAGAGRLPAYTFLEPNFGMHGNSQHPNYDVSAGETLIRDVYNALRSNADAWATTLFILTYDEHGGNYDHVPPPYGATPPDASVGEFDDFDFRSYGVRVPALLISPLIKKGTVFRASSGTIDHTSVLKTLEEAFSLAPLTARDRDAPSLGDVLTEAAARTDDPLANVQAPTAAASPLVGWRPSELELVHAWRVSQLPMPDSGSKIRQETPTFRSSADLHEYIEGRMARWDAHIASRRSGTVVVPYRTKRMDIVRAHPRSFAALKAQHARAPVRQRAGGPNIATGFKPNPRFDMTDHGGKKLATLSYLNVYLGLWSDGDVTNLDAALSAAISDPGLNNVVQQYFSNPVQTTVLNSVQQRKIALPSTFTRDDVGTTLETLRSGGQLQAVADFANTVVCLLLPQGIILDTSAASGVGTLLDKDDEDTSLEGLGGYHGSHPASDGTTIYFAVSVYSETTANGNNGIPAFPQSWKNVVATLYHELCESRTDPDVEEVNRTGNTALLGWYADARGAGEIGDIPINEAGGELAKVFVEVQLQSGQMAPIQLMWSNRVHGPEQP